MPHDLGLKQRMCVKVGILERSGAATPAAEMEKQDKESCKQSAHPFSKTCAPSPQHTYGERLWGRE